MKEAAPRQEAPEDVNKSDAFHCASDFDSYAYTRDEILEALKQDDYYIVVRALQSILPSHNIPPEIVQEAVARCISIPSTNMPIATSCMLTVSFCSLLVLLVLARRYHAYMSLCTVFVLQD